MGAGGYRHFVRFEKPLKIPDGGGGFTGTWETHTEEHALIERLQSFRFDVERMTAGGVGSMPIVRIHVRAHPLTETITSEMRVIDVDTGVHMNINFAQDLTGRGDEIVVTATENGPA